MAKSYYGRIVSRLELNIFPFLGDISIKKITAKDLLGVMRRIEEREGQSKTIGEAPSEYREPASFETTRVEGES